MSAQEPRAAVDPRSAADERTPSMRDLLAACAAADAVSRPPRAPAPEPVPEADDEEEQDSPDRRAAA